MGEFGLTFDPLRKSKTAATDVGWNYLESTPKAMSCDLID